MMKTNKNIYAELTPDDAALAIHAAEARIAAMGFGDMFCGHLLSGIKYAINFRRQSGFEVDPTSREEVGGLVSAVLASDGFDHIQGIALELRRFVTGYLQTGELTTGQPGMASINTSEASQQ